MPPLLSLCERGGHHRKAESVNSVSALRHVESVKDRDWRVSAQHWAEPKPRVQNCIGKRAIACPYVEKKLTDSRPYTPPTEVQWPDKKERKKEKERVTTCAQRLVARAARFVLLQLTPVQATSKKQHSTSTSKLNISVTVIYCDLGVVCFTVRGS